MAATRTTGWDHSLDGPLQQNFQALNKLRDDLNAGKIKQTDYVTQAKPLSEQVDKTLDYLSKYSGPAWGWAKSVGADTYLNDIKPSINIYQAAKNYLGRDITPTEYAQFKPRYADGAD